jgi:hypothetical protein
MSNTLGSKWVVHIIGQDDMFDFDNELAALRNANEINRDLATLLEEHGRHEHEPVVFAVAKQVPEGVYTRK